MTDLRGMRLPRLIHQGQRGRGGDRREGDARALLPSLPVPLIDLQYPLARLVDGSRSRRGWEDHSFIHRTVQSTAHLGQRRHVDLHPLRSMCPVKEVSDSNQWISPIHSSSLLSNWSFSSPSKSLTSHASFVAVRSSRLPLRSKGESTRVEDAFVSIDRATI